MNFGFFPLCSILPSLEVEIEGKFEDNRHSQAGDGNFRGPGGACLQTGKAHWVLVQSNLTYEPLAEHNSDRSNKTLTVNTCDMLVILITLLRTKFAV